MTIKIKMSEDFELPIRIQDVIDAPAYGHCTSIVIAVNAYDDNQERIAELETALLKLIDLAGECDSWESFPSKPLDDAYSVLEQK